MCFLKLRLVKHNSLLILQTDCQSQTECHDAPGTKFSSVHLVSHAKNCFSFQSRIGPSDIKMLQDVYCPDKTCIETRVFQTRCEILSGKNCSAPCDDSKCQIEVEYNVLCTVWDCKPLPTTTAMPVTTENPTPEPATGGNK